MERTIPLELIQDILRVAEKIKNEGVLAVKDDAASLKMALKEKVAEKPRALRGSGCNACGSCAACLADGPVPDAEFVAAGFLINLW
jgi:hypothetical protein